MRAHVDGVLKQAFGELAEQMKDALNEMAPSAVDLEHTAFFENVRAFAGAMSALGDGVAAYAGVMAALVNGATHLVLGFVPYVGPALDLCEAVTGKMYCLPNGADLTQGERVFSAIGFGFGSIMKPWKGVLNEGISPGGKAVASGVLSLGEEFALALQLSRRRTFHGLRAVFSSNIANEFEKKAGLHLMKQEGRQMLGVGDNAVREILGIPLPVGPQPKGLTAAPDYLSITKGDGLIVSEVKGGLVKYADDVEPQLKNALSKLQERNLLGDVEGVEIIMAKGQKFDDPNYSVISGYLVNLLKNNARVKVEGFKNFVRVIQL